MAFVDLFRCETFLRARLFHQTQSSGLQRPSPAVLRLDLKGPLFYPVTVCNVVLDMASDWYAVISRPLDLPSTYLGAVSVRMG
jgi:hypothetical protein